MTARKKTHSGMKPRQPTASKHSLKKQKPSGAKMSKLGLKKRNSSHLTTTKPGMKKLKNIQSTVSKPGVKKRKQGFIRKRILDIEFADSNTVTSQPESLDGFDCHENDTRMLSVHLTKLNPSGRSRELPHLDSLEKQIQCLKKDRKSSHDCNSAFELVKDSQDSGLPLPTVYIDSAYESSGRPNSSLIGDGQLVNQKQQSLESTAIQTAEPILFEASAPQVPLSAMPIRTFREIRVIQPDGRIVKAYISEDDINSSDHLDGYSGISTFSANDKDLHKTACELGPEVTKNLTVDHCGITRNPSPIPESTLEIAEVYSLAQDSQQLNDHIQANMVTSKITMETSKSVSLTAPNTLTDVPVSSNVSFRGSRSKLAQNRGQVKNLEWKCEGDCQQGDTIPPVPTVTKIPPRRSSCGSDRLKLRDWSNCDIDNYQTEVLDLSLPKTAPICVPLNLSNKKAESNFASLEEGRKMQGCETIVNNESIVRGETVSSQEPEQLSLRGLVDQSNQLVIHTGLSGSPVVPGECSTILANNLETFETTALDNKEKSQVHRKRKNLEPLDFSLNHVEQTLKKQRESTTLVEQESSDKDRGVKPLISCPDEEGLVDIASKKQLSVSLRNISSEYATSSVNYKDTQMNINDEKPSCTTTGKAKQDVKNEPKSAVALKTQDGEEETNSAATSKTKERTLLSNTKESIGGIETDISTTTGKAKESVHGAAEFMTEKKVNKDAEENSLPLEKLQESKEAMIQDGSSEDMAFKQPKTTPRKLSRKPTLGQIASRLENTRTCKSRKHFRKGAAKGKNTRTEFSLKSRRVSERNMIKVLHQNLRKKQNFNKDYPQTVAADKQLKDQYIKAKPFQSGQPLPPDNRRKRGRQKQMSYNSDSESLPETLPYEDPDYQGSSVCFSDPEDGDPLDTQVRQKAYNLLNSSDVLGKSREMPLKIGEKIVSGNVRLEESALSGLDILCSVASSMRDCDSSDVSSRSSPRKQRRRVSPAKIEKDRLPKSKKGSKTINPRKKRYREALMPANPDVLATKTTPTIKETDQQIQAEVLPGSSPAPASIPENGQSLADEDTISPTSPTSSSESFSTKDQREKSSHTATDSTMVAASQSRESSHREGSPHSALYEGILQKRELVQHTDSPDGSLQSSSPGSTVKQTVKLRVRYRPPMTDTTEEQEYISRTEDKIPSPKTNCPKTLHFTLLTKDTNTSQQKLVCKLDKVEDPAKPTRELLAPPQPQRLVCTLNKIETSAAQTSAASLVTEEQQNKNKTKVSEGNVIKDMPPIQLASAAIPKPVREPRILGRPKRRVKTPVQKEVSKMEKGFENTRNKESRDDTPVSSLLNVTTDKPAGEHETDIKFILHTGPKMDDSVLEVKSPRQSPSSEGTAYQQETTPYPKTGAETANSREEPKYIPFTVTREPSNIASSSRPVVNMKMAPAGQGKQHYVMVWSPKRDAFVKHDILSLSDRGSSSLNFAKVFEQGISNPNKLTKESNLVALVPVEKNKEKNTEVYESPCQDEFSLKSLEKTKPKPSSIPVTSNVGEDMLVSTLRSRGQTTSETQGNHDADQLEKDHLTMSSPSTKKNLNADNSNDSQKGAAKVIILKRPGDIKREDYLAQKPGNLQLTDNLVSVPRSPCLESSSAGSIRHSVTSVNGAGKGALQAGEETQIDVFSACQLSYSAKSRVRNQAVPPTPSSNAYCNGNGIQNKAQIVKDTEKFVFASIAQSNQLVQGNTNPAFRNQVQTDTLGHSSAKTVSLLADIPKDMCIEIRKLPNSNTKYVSLLNPVSKYNNVGIVGMHQHGADIKEISFATSSTPLQNDTGHNVDPSQENQAQSDSTFEPMDACDVPAKYQDKVVTKFLHDDQCVPLYQVTALTEIDLGESGDSNQRDFVLIDDEGKQVTELTNNTVGQSILSPQRQISHIHGKLGESGTLPSCSAAGFIHKAQESRSSGDIGRDSSKIVSDTSVGSLNSVHDHLGDPVGHVGEAPISLLEAQTQRKSMLSPVSNFGLPNQEEQETVSLINKVEKETETSALLPFMSPAINIVEHELTIGCMDEVTEKNVLDTHAEGSIWNHDNSSAAFLSEPLLDEQLQPSFGVMNSDESEGRMELENHGIEDSVPSFSLDTASLKKKEEDHTSNDKSTECEAPKVKYRSCCTQISKKKGKGSKSSGGKLKFGRGFLQFTKRNKNIQPKRNQNNLKGIKKDLSSMSKIMKPVSDHTSNPPVVVQPKDLCIQLTRDSVQKCTKLCGAAAILSSSSIGKSSSTNAKHIQKNHKKRKSDVCPALVQDEPAERADLIPSRGSYLNTSEVLSRIPQPADVAAVFDITASDRLSFTKKVSEAPSVDMKTKETDGKDLSHGSISQHPVPIMESLAAWLEESTISRKSQQESATLYRSQGRSPELQNSLKFSGNTMNSHPTKPSDVTNSGRSLEFSGNSEEISLDVNTFEHTQNSQKAASFDKVQHKLVDNHRLQPERKISTGPPTVIHRDSSKVLNECWSRQLRVLISKLHIA